MIRDVRRALRKHGLRGTAKRGMNLYLKKLLRKRQKSLYSEGRELLRCNGLNLCYNDYLPEVYDPGLDNVLIAVESPAYFRDGYSHHERGWLRDDMEFVAEISWERLTDCDVHYCPRALFTTHDGFVDFEPDAEYDKSELVSLIYSSKENTEGHQIRHRTAEAFGDRIDCYGSGAGAFIREKVDALSDYRFHVAIENVQTPNYVTEKFFDPVKTLTVPIYRGGSSSVEKLGFDTDGVLFFETLDELDEILDDLSPSLYESLRPAMEYNRRRLMELRDQQKLRFYLASSVQHSYMHSTQSFNYGPLDVAASDLVWKVVKREYPGDLCLHPDGEEGDSSRRSPSPRRPRSGASR